MVLERDCKDNNETVSYTYSTLCIFNFHRFTSIRKFGVPYISVAVTLPRGLVGIIPDEDCIARLLGWGPNMTT